jgi:hypothetical protein
MKTYNASVETLDAWQRELREDLGYVADEHAKKAKKNDNKAEELERRAQEARDRAEAEKRAEQEAKDKAKQPEIKLEKKTR